MSKKKHTRVELTFRVIFFVTLFFVVLAGIFYCLAHSEKFVLFVGEHISDIIKSNNKSIKIVGISGTINSGIDFKEFYCKDLTNGVEIKAEKGKVSFDFERMFTVGMIAVNANIERVYANNALKLGNIFEKVPVYNGPACFVDIPSNIELNEINIATLAINISGYEKSRIIAKKVAMSPMKNSAAKSLQFQCDFVLKNVYVGVASFSGEFLQKQKKINGKADIRLVGQHIVTELNLASKRSGNIEIGGYISESKIDTEVISKWLGVMWQEKVPIFVNGGITCAGSWLYNSNVGFMGNLSGTCDDIKIILYPFNFILAEFSNSWNILNGNLSINDKGSFFLGANAAFNGKIEAVFNKDERKWDSVFECKNLNIASFSKMLPMPILYSFKIPKLEGKADFSLITVGKEPNTTLRVVSNDITTEIKDTKCRLSGYAAWMMAQGFNNLEANISIKRIMGNPDFFARFSETKSMFIGVPLAFEYKLHGDPKTEMNLKGKFITGEGREERERGEATGVFSKRSGYIKANFEKNLEYGGTTSLTLLDLFLAR